MQEQISISIVYPEKGLLWCEVTLTSTSESGSIELNDPVLGRQFVFTSYDLLEALYDWHKEYFQRGIRILCNGCRRDFHASGMSRDMGGGRKGYLIKHGFHAKSGDVVDIFESANLEDICSREDQERYFKAWLDSNRQ